MSTNEISRSDSSKATSENDQQRFSQGVLFRGKLFGVEDVKKETGDDVCNDSMIKLKAVLAAKKESKKRICIKINLEGIEIIDEATSSPIYTHSVNKISYIARDVKDARAIGYIYKNSENNFQYFGLRTIDQAQTVFNTLKDLFEVVLKMRQKKKEVESTTDTTGNTTPTTPTPTNNNNNNNNSNDTEKEPLIDSPTTEENNEKPNLFDIETPEPVAPEQPEPIKSDDIFGLLALSNSTHQFGLNPSIPSIFNNGDLGTLSPPTTTMQPNIQRPSPAMPNNPMNTFGMNPMMNSMGQMGPILQQQQQFQGFPNNSMMNPHMNPPMHLFGNALNNQLMPMNTPMNSPMQPPAGQFNQFQTANKPQQQVNKPW